MSNAVSHLRIKPPTAETLADQELELRRFLSALQLRRSEGALQRRQTGCSFCAPGEMGPTTGVAECEWLSRIHDRRSRASGSRTESHRTEPEGGAPEFDGKARSLKASLRNGYLNQKYGFKFSPALAWGRWITPLMPWRQMSIDKGVRHLPLKQLGARMLDVGCGQGAFVSPALSLGWNAEGLDPDPEAVKVGRSKGLRIARGRLSDTCFPDSSFAAVTMSHSIEHLHDPINSLREIYRILRARRRHLDCDTKP